MKFLAGLLCFTAPLAYAGWSSNGGDHWKDQDNPWFIDARQVNYCIKVDSSYSLSEIQVEQVVAESISDWLNFLSVYGLDDFVFGGPALNIRFKDGVFRKLTTSFVKLKSCDVADSSSLQFYFGVKNKAITAALSQRSGHSRGISLRQDYNHQSFINGGYVWIDNFSDEEKRIKHLVLHELGHVFGMKHDSVFVMDARVADRLWTPHSDLSGFLGRIEVPWWPFQFRSGPSYSFRSYSLRPDGWVSNTNMPREFLDLFRTSEGDSHKMTIGYKRYSSVSGTHFFTTAIEIMGLPNGKFEFYLALRDSKLDERAAYLPGLFTDWVDLTTGFERRFEFLMSNNFKPRLMNGYAIIGARKYAAILANKNGVRLRIFGPNEGIWWEIR